MIWKVINFCLLIKIKIIEIGSLLAMVQPIELSTRDLVFFTFNDQNLRSTGKKK